jgi:hypothetical protein
MRCCAAGNLSVEQFGVQLWPSRCSAWVGEVLSGPPTLLTPADALLGSKGEIIQKAPHVTILLIEQNAKQALQISDYGLVLEQGQTRIEGTAANILADPRIAQLFLGRGLAAPERVT